MSIDPFKIFLDLMLSLPRAGPGSPENTRAALAAVPDLPPEPEIADLGCGFGTATLELLAETNGRVIAVDSLKLFLTKLEARAEEAGISETRLRTVCADMMEADLPSGIFDLVWCEAAVYAVGFEEGLSLFHRLLKPGGTAIVSDAVWLTSDPPQEAVAFWAGEYPEMANLETRLAQAEAAGFEPVTHILLPDAAWESEYYGPMEPRIAELERQNASQPPETLAPLAELRREIAIRRRYAESFGYATFVLRKK